MKQKAALFLLTAVALVFAGCAAKTSDFSVADTAQKLSQGIPFSDPLSPIETDVAIRLYEIAPEDVREAAVYVGTGGATVDEVSVWKATDSAAAVRIEQAVRERVQAQKTVYQDYQPAEIPKLDHPVVLVHGDVVILCVSGFEEQAREILSASLS